MKFLIHNTLKTNITMDATYNKQHKDECHEGTRQQLLSKIDDWLADSSDSIQRCWWITGLAAIGKSTIAITIAKSLEDGEPIRPTMPQLSDEQGSLDADHTAKSNLEFEHEPLETSSRSAPSPILGAQYFINQKLGSTSNPHNIFPTIAARLSNLSDSVQLYLHDTIKHLIKKDATHKLLTLSEYQANTLFLKPLKAIAQSLEFKNCVIVVILDGIDELHRAKPLDEEPLDPLPLFTTILCTIAKQLPSNVRVLVLSRPEQPIVQSLSAFTSSVHTLPFPLDGMLEDVDRFLKDKEKVLAESADGQNWPSSEQIDIIRSVAQGYIVIAKIAILWVQTKYDDEGMLGGNSAFIMIKEVKNGDIYHFYLKLLSKVVPDSSSVEFKEGCTFILACLAFAQNETIGTVQRLFRMKYPKNTFDVFHFFARIRSITMQNTSRIDHNTVPTPHKSLLDYIISDHPPFPFHIDVGHWQSQFSELCFGIMRDPKFLHFNMGHVTTSSNTGLRFNEFKNSRIFDKRRPCFFEYQEGEPKPVDPLVNYACDTLHIHLSEANLTDERTLEIVNVVMMELFLFWIEAIALMQYHKRRHVDYQSGISELEHPMLRTFLDLIKVCIFYISRFANKVI